jgi:DnaJ-class molecular chaperone
LGRPTRPFSKGISSKIKFEFEYSFNKEKIKFTKNRSGKSFPKNVTLTSEIQNSIEIFKLNNDFDENILKKRYKELVKKYHPDLNKNYLNKQKKIKQINKAYNILLKFLKN